MRPMRQHWGRALPGISQARTAQGGLTRGGAVESALGEPLLAVLGKPAVYAGDRCRWLAVVQGIMLIKVAGV